MNCELKPYITVDKNVYFTDGTEEIIVYEFDSYNQADVVSTLLNDAYNHAYHDGQNASINTNYKELIKMVISLSIENRKLKEKLKLV